MDYLSQACAALGVDPQRVAGHKVYETEIVLLVDNGIKGTHKHRVPLSELQQPDVKPEPEPVAVEPAAAAQPRKKGRRK